MITRGRLAFAIICLILLGSLFVVEAFQIFSIRNAPIITGRIVAREVIERSLMPPKANFTILIEESAVPVHAYVSKHLLMEIPDAVHFRYSGDPTREVFLFEHEDPSYWIVLLSWGIAAVLMLTMRFAFMRRFYGWQS